MSASPVAVRLARALPGLLREVESGPEHLPLLLGGEARAVEDLLGALASGGDSSFLRVVSAAELERADIRGAAIVYAIRGAVSRADERALEQADRRGLPLICLALDVPRREVLPYVRATDVVRGAAVDQEVIAAVAHRVASTSEESGWALARGLPALRRPVAAALVRRCARQNALIGAAVFVPGADLPILTLNQLRMALRIGAAFGREADGARKVSLGVVVVAGVGLRAVARGSTRRLPVPGFLVKAAIAGAATWAMGIAVTALAERRAT